jgi:phosphohistidine phosphatase
MFYVNLGLNETTGEGFLPLLNNMKKVTLIRHAKSDWGSEFLRDIDRPLNERGYRDAYYTSEWYVKNQEAPGCMISSPATRALNTALIFARAMSYSIANFHLNENIYEASAATLLNVIRAADKAHAHIMLFGHNPGFTNLCNELSEHYFDNVPTCGIVSFAFNADNWSEISPKGGVLNYYHFPKEYRMKD